MSIEQDSATLTDFLRSGRVALMIGSGPSTDAGLLSWSALENELRQKLKARGLPSAQRTVYDLVDAFANELGETEMQRILRRAFRNPNVSPGELDLLIGSLRMIGGTHGPSVEFVVTLNYDKLLETAFRVLRFGIDPPTTTSLEVASRWLKNQEFFILKFHGDIDQPASIAFGHTGYGQLKYDELFTFLSGYRLLFVGYGFADPILDHFLTRASDKKVLDPSSSLVLIQNGDMGRQLARRGYNVVHLPDYNYQKELLRRATQSLVIVPRDAVQRAMCQPNDVIRRALGWERVERTVVAAAGRMVVLHEEWLAGWDAFQLRYKRLGQHALTPHLESIVATHQQEVERPWWGKLSMAGFARPTSEQFGTLRVRSTSFEKYMVLWQQLDSAVGPGAPTLRDTYFVRDLSTCYEEPDLPHILCAHTVLITTDDRVLLTRRSKDRHFEGLAWCPSLEEQAADGAGEATEEELEAYRAEFGEKPLDQSLADTVLRGLHEELGISREKIASIRCFALASDWKYSDLVMITVARTTGPACELEPFIGIDTGEFERHGPTRIQFRWLPIQPERLIDLCHAEEYEPEAGWRGPWHASARLRFFALFCSLVQTGHSSWDALAHLLRRD